MGWTEQQLSAIMANNPTLLVSAAAGSGKTAVLVERIVRLIRDGGHLDRMMIVTFTRAAAAEMRARLAKRLADEAVRDRRLRTALDELEHTRITTLHGFCDALLHEEFQAAGLDPMFSVADDTQAAVLFEQATKDAFNQLLEEGDPDVLLLADSFPQPVLNDWAKQLYSFLMSLPHPFAWLEEQIRQTEALPQQQQAWFIALANQLRLQATDLRSVCEAEQQLLTEPAAVDSRKAIAEADAELLQQLLSAAERLYQTGEGTDIKPEWARLPAFRGKDPAQYAWNEAFKTLHNAYKKDAADFAAHLRWDASLWSLEKPRLIQLMRALQKLAVALSACYARLKDAKDWLTFDDLEQRTLTLLENAELRSRLCARFDELFVDECQDISAIQDAIIQYLHDDRNRLFMVGDVKQSIYRFRKAEPTLFIRRTMDYSDAEDASCRRIFLQKNFRSTPSVLEGANLVFRRIMRADVTEIDYLPQDELIPGREDGTGEPIEVIEVFDTTDGSSTDTRLQAQAAVAAKRMKALVASGAYRYADMAILMSTMKRVGRELATALENEGIPVFCDDQDSFLDSPEVALLYSLLTVLDSPRHDTDLIAVLHQPPFDVSDEELAAIRLASPDKKLNFYEAVRNAAAKGDPLGRKLQAALDKLSDWSFRSRHIAVSELIPFLLDETALLLRAGAMPDGRQRQANLRMMIHQAYALESMGGRSLHDFLSYVRELKTRTDGPAAAPLAAGDDLVQIMSMHKSKGLEFPVVFVLNLQQKGQAVRTAPTELLLHARLGMGVPYVNPELNIRRKTMMRDGITQQSGMETLAEKVRLLYVAMTRARDRLILMGGYPANQYGKPPEFLKNNILGLPNMMEWIRFALATTRDDASMFHVEQCLTEPGAAAEETELREDRLGSLWSELQSLPAETPSLQRPLAGQRIRSAKTSVSALVKEMTYRVPYTEAQENEGMTEKAAALGETLPLLLSDLPDRPAFMQKKQTTAAERGTLAHRALALTDLQILRRSADLTENLRGELRRLTEAGHFTAEQAKQVNPASLAAFYQSPIGQRLMHAETVRREWHFTHRISPVTLLQGVIDAAFADGGGWVLVDYKTDATKDGEELIRRYALQLNLYADAVEDILHQPVREIWLFALKTGQAYPVPRSKNAVQA